jgi:hypothetical protein
MDDGFVPKKKALGKDLHLGKSLFQQNKSRDSRKNKQERI